MKLVYNSNNIPYLFLVFGMTEIMASVHDGGILLWSVQLK